MDLAKKVALSVFLALVCVVASVITGLIRDTEAAGSEQQQVTDVWVHDATLDGERIKLMTAGENLLSEKKQIDDEIIMLKLENTRLNALRNEVTEARLSFEREFYEHASRCFGEWSDANFVNACNKRADELIAAETNLNERIRSYNAQSETFRSKKSELKNRFERNQRLMKRAYEAMQAFTRRPV